MWSEKKNGKRKEVRGKMLRKQRMFDFPTISPLPNSIYKHSDYS